MNFISSNSQFQYKSTEFNDLVIAAGKDVNLDTYAETTTLMQGVSKVSDVYTKRMQELEQSYSAHKEKILNPTYDHYLTNVLRQRKTLLSAVVDSDIRQLIAVKLENLAKDYQSNRENYNGFVRFFKRLGGISKGYGFRTKGEYGLKVAQSMKERNETTLKEEIHAYIGQKFGNQVPLKPDTIARLNKQAEKEFISTIYYDVLSYSKDKFFLGTSLTYKLYTQLTPPNQTLFNHTLLNHYRWFDELYYMVDKLDPEILKAFLSQLSESFNEDFFIKFFNNFQNLKDTIRADVTNNETKFKLFRQIDELIIKKLLQEGSANSFTNIRTLIQSTVASNYSLYEGPYDFLTPADLQKINDVYPDFIRFKQ